jgi:starch-binding outer membrane protein, SusD/RagB family
MKKNIIYLSLLSIIIGFSSCKKIIDLSPESAVKIDAYYTSAEEVRTALVGCYYTQQRPMNAEWQLTELRSDNTKMGVPASSNTVNRDLSDLDVFAPATGHPAVYEYWISSYFVIRNANIVLQKLGVKYDKASNALNLLPINISLTDSLRKQFIGEALFIRANAYFNLVRLYGGVFLVDEPITLEQAKQINRSSKTDIYNFIKKDLTTAVDYLSKLKATQITANTVGNATTWAAKGMLAKVHLTLNDKASAIPLLQDIITNSGYGLQGSYSNVFSITNEMSTEILYAIRYKAGGVGLGSRFGNDFAPLGSLAVVINGSGLGYNYPTSDLDTAMGITTSDPRKGTCFGIYTAARVLYVKKFLTPVTTANDGESDWPVLRYADIVLMLAEAQGFTPASITLINSIRTRSGLAPLPVTVNTVALFEQALSNERRFEFAFENQRFFDLVRFNSTLTTITAEQTIKNHMAKEFNLHYAQYNPVVPLNILQANVTANKLLLPIPQKEIDTNTQLVIAQNPGY